jgi:hypothetical protein
VTGATFEPTKKDKEKHKQMKKLVMIVALLVSASISAMADDIVNRVNDVPKVTTPMAELPQTMAPLGWYMITTVNGPRIPAGWQIAGIEGVIYNGNSVNRWQIYLYNPTTRATAGWLIGIN